MLQLGRGSGDDDKIEALLDNEMNGNTVEVTYSKTEFDNSESRPSVMRKVAGFIIVTEFCERIAYYGFAGSLILLLQTRLGMSNEEADIQYSVWSSACYITTFIGGYLADTYLGRYQTILVFSTLYLFGLILVVIGCIPGHVSGYVIFTAIYLIALASGGIKPNVSTMGADQFDDRFAQDRKEKESFFNWFYWSINLGSLISYTAVSYICQFGIPALGGLPWGFSVGFSVPAIMMVLAILVFVGGSDRYKLVPPQGSVLSIAAKILYEAICSRAGQPLKSGFVLDRASEEFGGSFPADKVEAVRLVVRLLPFCLVIVPYWAVYNQMNTSFQNQSCQMQLSVGSTAIPVTTITIVDTIFVLLLVPLFDLVVYPVLKRFRYHPSMLQKIGFGFLLATFAMLTAAWTEEYRLDQSPPPGNYTDVLARSRISPCQRLSDYNPFDYQQWASGGGGTKPRYCWQSCSSIVTNNGTNPMLDMNCVHCENIPQTSAASVLVQIPQFALVGASEVLASITALEFFYSQAPASMRSLCQSMNMATTAVSSLLVIPLIKAVNTVPTSPWVSNNLDSGHLNYFFYLLAFIMVLDHMLLWWLSRDYKYKDEQSDVIDVFTVLNAIQSPIESNDSRGDTSPDNFAQHKNNVP